MHTDLWSYSSILPAALKKYVPRFFQRAISPWSALYRKTHFMLYCPYLHVSGFFISEVGLFGVCFFILHATHVIDGVWMFRPGFPFFLNRSAWVFIFRANIWRQNVVGGRESNTVWYTALGWEMQLSFTWRHTLKYSSSSSTYNIYVYIFIHSIADSFRGTAQ